MNPRLRLLIAGSIGALLAVFAANSIADESYGLASMVAVAVLWIAVEWRGGSRPEAWILSAILFGYIVGSRGFAQLQLTPSIPLLPAEAALFACTLGLGIRAAMSKTSVIAFNGVNLSILVWAAYASARLPMDMRDYGVMALRDYALVYYAVFFFLSQYLCRDPSSERLLGVTLTTAFLALPAADIIDKAAPGFYGQHLTWNGIPLVYYKSDLLSASLACGSFWLWSRYELSRNRWWLVPSAVSLLLVGAEESPRAALVAAAVTTLAWMFARRFRLLGFQVAVVVVGIAVSLPVELSLGKPLIETKSFEMYERAVSLVDWGGSHAYRNSSSAGTTDNNEFRRVWWRAVYDETVATSPLFGLGFGHDLAARFLADYNWLSVEEEFNTRSPHSIIVTNLGRLGFVGLGLFLVAASMIARSAFRAFRAADIESMAWWSVVITVGASACFGVVLEGPMGAVVFWVCLGVAQYKTVRTLDSGPDPTPYTATRTVDSPRESMQRERTTTS